MERIAQEAPRLTYTQDLQERIIRHQGRVQVFQLLDPSLNGHYPGLLAKAIDFYCQNREVIVPDSDFAIEVKKAQHSKEPIPNKETFYLDYIAEIFNKDLATARKFTYGQKEVGFNWLFEKEKSDLEDLQQELDSLIKTSDQPAGVGV